MYAICATFHINPGMMDAFMPIMQRQAERSLTRESGCHQFDVCTDPLRVDEVFLYELYDDAAAFQLHLASEHFKQFDEAASGMLADKTVNTYTTVYQAKDR